MSDTLISLGNLSTYDALIKTYIGDADDVINAKSIKTVLWDSTAEQIKFYKKENATLADTADYAVSISSSDVQDLKTRVGITTTLNGYNSATDLTSIMNILTGNSSTTGSLAKGVADAESYADGLIAALDADVDASGTPQHSGVMVVTGITEADGVITGVDSAEVEAAGAAAALAATLADVATSGDAEDVAYDNTTSGLTATDVQAAIDEVAAASAGGVGSKTVYITETAGGTSDTYSKRYGIYQGSSGSTSSPVAAEKLADIDIPKDMVVESGSVVDIVFVSSDNSLHEGSASGTDVTAAIKGTDTATAADAGKYIKLVIANSTSTALYIKATDLVDIYTAEQNASQIQITIDSSNVISAEIVDGSVDTDALASGAVTKAKLAQAVQDSLDLADSAVQSVAEGTTDGTVSVDGTDVAVHGLGSAAYTASTAYDAAGSADTAEQNAKDYADGLYTVATTQDIENLFPNS